MRYETSVRSEPVACPICGRPLKWTADRWLAVFECDRCGRFSDFGDASLSLAQSRHHTPYPYPRRPGLPPEKS